MLEGVAFGGDGAEGGDDEAAEGLEVGILGELEREGAVEVGDGHAGVDFDGAVVDAFEFIGGGAFVFVGDVADDFFDDVFGGEQAGGAAVFVEDDGEVALAVAEFAEEVAEGFGAGDEDRGTHEGAEVDGGFGGGIRCPPAGGAEEGEEVLGVENADDVVEGAFVDGDAGEAFLEDFVAEVEDGRVHFDGDDFGARGHDLADLEIAEADDAFDHFLLVFVDGPLGGAFGDHGEDFLAGGFDGGFGVVGIERAAGEAADDFVKDGEDAHGGPEREMRKTKQRPGEREEGVAGVLGPGLRDRDGEDEEGGDGDEDGEAEDFEGVGESWNCWRKYQPTERMTVTLVMSRRTEAVRARS